MTTLDLIFNPQKNLTLILILKFWSRNSIQWIPPTWLWIQNFIGATQQTTVICACRIVERWSAVILESVVFTIQPTIFMRSNGSSFRMWAIFIGEFRKLKKKRKGFVSLRISHLIRLIICLYFRLLSMDMSSISSVHYRNGSNFRTQWRRHYVEQNRLKTSMSKKLNFETWVTTWCTPSPLSESLNRLWYIDYNQSSLLGIDKLCDQFRSFVTFSFHFFKSKNDF